MNSKSIRNRPVLNSRPGEPTCPRCGDPLKRSLHDRRVTERSLHCSGCGFWWNFGSSTSGVWTPGEIFSERCPACSASVVPSARYCVACGRALPGVEALFKSFANRAKVPLEVFEEQAWHEDNTIAALWEAVFWLETRSGELTRRLTDLDQQAAIAPAAATARVIEVAPPVQPAGEPPLGIGTEAAPEPEVVPDPSTEVLEPVAVAAVDLMDEPAASAVAQRSTLRWPDTSPVGEIPIPTTGGTASPVPPRKAIDFEQMISGRGMAFAGGAAVLLGTVFFLSLAFSRGWIGPELRVAMGVATAIVLIMLGGLCFGRKEEVFGHVVTATGLGIMSLSMFAATRLYDLFPVELGLLGSIAAAGAAAAIAIRFDLQIVAGYGLVAALAAPPLLGASVNGVTIALLATTLIGITAIALKRIWIWLPPAAFLLASPQLADWIATRPAALPGIVALAGFWLLNALAAGGEAYQRPHSRLRPTSATLLVGNAAFLVWGGSTVLDNDFGPWGGSFLLGVALAHGALGGWFLRNRGDRDPFGMLAFGTGVAALTMAIPVQFGGALVPIAFAAEATALAWVAGRLKHPYAGASAVLLGGLSITHALMFEYPMVEFESNPSDPRAFLNGSFLTVAFQLVALAVAAYFVRIERVRQVIATIGIALLAYALPFEVSGVWLVAGWSLVAAVGFMLISLPGWQQGEGFRRIPGRMLLMLASTGVLVAAVLHMLTIEFPIEEVTSNNTAATPFLNSNGFAFTCILAVLAVIAWIESGRYRFPATLSGIGLAFYIMPFELSGVGLVAGWSFLAAVGFMLFGLPAWQQGVGSSRISGRALLMLASTGVLAAAVLHVLFIEYPLDEITSDHTVSPPFLNLNGLAIGCVLAAIAVLGWIESGRFRIPATAAGIGMIFYAMPFELSGVALVAGWSMLAAAGFVLVSLPGWRQGSGSRRISGRFWLTLTSTSVLVAAVLHVIRIEYPIDDITSNHTASPPFLNSNGLALALVLASLAVIGWIESGRYRLPATIAGIGLILFAMPFELSGVALVGGWALASLVPLYLRSFSSFNQLPDTCPTQEVDRAVVARFGLIIPGVVAWLLAAAHTLTIEFYDARTDGNAGTPFTDCATLAAGMLIAAAIGAYALTRTERWSSVWVLAGITTAAAMLPTQVGPASVVVGWSVLGACSLLLAQRLTGERQIYLWTTLVLAGLGLMVALNVASPDRLFVNEAGFSPVDSHPLFWSGASAALAALASLLAVAAWRFPNIPFGRWLGVIAGALSVYLLSVGIVDHFQGQVETVGLDALQKRAQVALSILWATLGGAAFVAGIVLRRRILRLFGLGLLGMATVKVFVYDMASLDASYRVLSLIGLGLLLLASSYLYMRFIGGLDEDDRDGSQDTSEMSEVVDVDQSVETLPGE